MHRFALLSALTLGLTAVSHADTISTFNFSNVVHASGASTTGTVTVDTTTGTFQSINAAYTSGSTVIDFIGAPVLQSSFDNGTQFFGSFLDNAASPMNDLLIDLPVSSLVGYMGGSLCSLSAPCDKFSSFITNTSGTTDRISTGSLAATPEPSSLVLLGTGLVGMFGVAKRRLLNS